MTEGPLDRGASVTRRRGMGTRPPARACGVRGTIAWAGADAFLPDAWKADDDAYD